MDSISCEPLTQPLAANDVLVPDTLTANLTGDDSNAMEDYHIVEEPAEKTTVHAGTDCNGASTRHVEEPRRLQCPITHTMFRDPVFTEGGNTYEMTAISDYWQKQQPPFRDPLTNEVLRSKHLTINWDKRREIQEFLEQNADYIPEGWEDRTLPPSGLISTRQLAPEHFGVRFQRWLPVCMFVLQGVLLALIAQTDPQDANAPSVVGVENRNSDSVLESVVDPQQLSPELQLLVVAGSGHVESVRALLKDGVDPNHAEPHSGITPLLQASETGHAKVVQVLLANGADPRHAAHDGTFPLLVAVRDGHLGSVRALLEKGADPEQASIQSGIFPLLMAVHYGHAESVHALLEKGANPNQICTQNGIFPLLMASHKGNVESVHALLESRADPQQVDPVNKAFPLMMAVHNGHVDIVRVLLENGASLKQLGLQDEAFKMEGTTKVDHVESVPGGIAMQDTVTSDHVERVPGGIAIQSTASTAQTQAGRWQPWFCSDMTEQAPIPAGDGSIAAPAPANDAPLASTAASSALASPFDAPADKPPLALMENTDQTREETQEIIVDGNPVKMDKLGPVVVNTDGSINRISNWHDMTELEQKKTLRIIGKRNQQRLAALKAQAETIPSSS